MFWPTVFLFESLILRWQSLFSQFLIHFTVTPKYWKHILVFKSLRVTVIWRLKCKSHSFLEVGWVDTLDLSSGNTWCCLQLFSVSSPRAFSSSWVKNMKYFHILYFSKGYSCSLHWEKHNVNTVFTKKMNLDALFTNVLPWNFFKERAYF